MVRNMGFKELLKKVVPESVLHEIPRSFDIVGEAAIIELPEKFLDYGQLIGEAIKSINKNIKAVYAKTTNVSGIYRTPKIVLIWGEDLKYTLYKEYGVTFVVSLGEVYVNPRLAYEHVRVARMVEEGETIIDMFAGIGGFTLHIASRSTSTTYAIDINPEAIKCLALALSLNRIKGKVICIRGDSKSIIPKYLKGVASRVIMNLPLYSKEFIESALMGLKEEGGIIHYYSIGESASHVITQFISSIRRAGGFVGKILTYRRVFEYSPYINVYVVDAWAYPVL